MIFNKLKQLLSILFIICVIAKYVFNVKIHEKYIFFICAALIFVTNFGDKYSAIEMFDGSSVAFDKEAFENLNRVVNEIAGEGKLTIPGNLVVQGKTTCEGDVDFNKAPHCKQGLYIDSNKKINFNNGKVNIKGDSTFGLVFEGTAPKILCDKVSVQGGTTTIDKTDGIVTTKNLKTYGQTTCHGKLVCAGEVDFNKAPHCKQGLYIDGDKKIDFKGGTTTIQGHSTRGLNFGGTKQHAYMHMLNVDQLQGHAWGRNEIYLRADIPGIKVASDINNSTRYLGIEDHDTGSDTAARFWKNKNQFNIKNMRIIKKS